MKPTVFIQSNQKQRIGALVAAHALRRNSAHSDAFEVRLIEAEEFPFLAAREGQAYLRAGVERIWRMNDLQSFTPLRFLPPQLMGFQGRALVIDPDVFALADVWALLSRDMQGKAILARRRREASGKYCVATSVMLLDCASLRDWDVEREFAELFERKRDYKDWICLHHIPAEKKGLLETEWNDFDRLTPATKMVHNTRRETQPWKTGLPVDFVPAQKVGRHPLRVALGRLRARVFGEYAFLGHYKQHPDPNQEALFFALLRECIDDGSVTQAQLSEAIARNYVRPDALELVRRSAPCASLPARTRSRSA